MEKLERGISKASGNIRWEQLVEIGIKNLFYKKLRTSLTISGVMIGVGAVVYLLAFGFGLRQVVTSQVVDSNSIRTIDVESAKSQLVKLDQETISVIEGTEAVEKVARMYSRASQTSFENAKLESVLYAVDQEYINLANIRLLAGEPPEVSKNGVAFVNSSYIKALGAEKPEDALNKQISFSFEQPVRSVDAAEDGSTETTTLTATIAGILETGSGAEIYISSQVFEEAGIEDASQLKVLVSTQQAVPDVQKKIEALGLVTNSPLSTLDQINQVFAFLNLLFLGFGGIGLIIAVLGMFNTLTISLLERTKEIGLMITLGARKKDIRRLFIVEAVGLSFIGGIAGTLGAFILSRITDVILNGFARSRGVSESFTIFQFRPELLLLVFGFSIVLGLLVVYLPAKRAANINPIEALKT